jgi:hypothetical protein
MRILSKHIRELSIIGALALAVGVPLISFIIIDGIENNDLDKWVPLAAAVSTVFSAIIGWAYQTGNKRLGVVDMFHAEILTLCKACQVSDLVGGEVFIHFHPKLMRDSSTVSEQYSTIYSQSAKELAALNQDITLNISQYYTLLQASREAYRLLGTPHMGLSEDDSWKERSITFIYFIFLALEAARSALAELIDDRDRRDEAVLIALLSEWFAYCFLLDQWHKTGPDAFDIRAKRIAAREENYIKLFKQFQDRSGRSRNIIDLCDDLQQIYTRYKAINPENKSEVPPRVLAYLTPKNR